MPRSRTGETGFRQRIFDVDLVLARVWTSIAGITKCYVALHTTGPEYIIKDIAGLIEERRWTNNK